ncbi:MAG: recombinase family protein [Dysosmobacter sp.]|nr:recombinase family protein [Dysosmobacter sp.]
MENLPVSPLRVALYVRVSGQEQAIKGLSLEAQQEDLQEYCRERGWIVAGVYIDAAKTARKRLGKRTNFLRMLEDVKRDKVDLILFTRLDRWFRSVADYYKVMEVLEAHGCGWKTTQEQYDTSTAGGRLYINLRLSIAQNEADLCGERIAVVFDSKIKHGTAVSGCCPFGYRVNEEKRLEVVPEQAAIVQDAFQHYKATVSQRGTIKYIRETYGLNWTDTNFRRILHDRLYTGYYDRNGRTNESFCPAIIPQELFDAVQKLLSNNAKSNPTGRVYLFTSILVCAECGHKLAGHQTNGKYYYYRCSQHYRRDLCSHDKEIREEVVEAWLFENLGRVFQEWRTEWEVKEAQRKQSAAAVDRAAVRRKLSRLKELYLNEVIDLEEYKRDYEALSAQLEERPALPPAPRPNFEAVEAFLAQDFRQIYDTLEREEKRTLWRSIIKEIRIDNDQQVKGLSFL